MSPLQVWQGWTAPTTDGELAQRREAVLLNVLAGILVLSLVMQVIQWYDLIARTHQAVAWLLVNLLVVGPAFYGLLRLARAGRHRLSAAALVVILALLGLALLVADGVNNPMWTLVLALTVLLAAILLGGRTGLATIGLSAPAILPIVALQDAGTLKPLEQLYTGVTGAVGLVLVMGFMALVCWIYTRDYLVGIDEVLTRSALSSPLRQLRTKTLSMREIEVVQLVAEGLSNDAIAQRLFVSPRTVQSHVATAMKKSDCANRTELGVLALREGIVPLQDEAPVRRPISGGRALDNPPG